MTLSPKTWQIRLGDDETTAAWDPPSMEGSGAVFVCAHGAGGHMGDRSILALSAVLRERGLGIVRFNFLYRARGSGRPDPMPRLLACFDAVVDRVRAELNPDVLLLGGRSMGGRAASVSVSQDARCDGLLLLAYPLHPPGQLEKLRTAHLAAIRTPVLCINGTRDVFCDRTLMERTLAGLGTNWRMHWLEGADHSFHVLKRSGRTDTDVLAEVANEYEAWRAGPISIAAVSPNGDDAVCLIRELDEELRRRYPGWIPHGLRAEEMNDPRLVFLVARAGGRAIGCGAVRELEPGVGEVKRMFVVDEWRGRGVARQILSALESRARERGYVTLRIETGKGQPEAISLYRSAGYADIPPFGDYVGNPVSVCFEKRLSVVP